MRIKNFLMGLGLTTVLATEAFAVPLLQLFIESDQNDGSSGQQTFWDASTQTWARVGNTPFYLWAVVQTRSPDKTYTWSQLNFTAVGPSNYFDANQTNGVFSATATAAGGTTIAGYNVTSGPNFGVSSDLSNPLPGGYLAPTGVGVGTPCCGSTVPYNYTMPTHGEYGAGRTWAFWDLLQGGTLSGDNTNLGQFQPTSTTEPFFGSGNYPTQVTNEYGYIFRYYVNPVGLNPGDVVHFDLWGLVSACDPGNGNCTGYEVAPFSHDARWEQGEGAPAPGALALLGLGLFGLAGLGRRAKS